MGYFKTAVLTGAAFAGGVVVGVNMAAAAQATREAAEQQAKRRMQPPDDFRPGGDNGADDDSTEDDEGMDRRDVMGANGPMGVPDLGSDLHPAGPSFPQPPDPESLFGPGRGQVGDLYAEIDMEDLAWDLMSENVDISSPEFWEEVIEELERAADESTPDRDGEDAN